MLNSNKHSNNNYDNVIILDVDDVGHHYNLPDIFNILFSLQVKV